MPCNSEYMEPTVEEKQIKQAERLLVYVRKQLRFLGNKTASSLARGFCAGDDYAKDLAEL